MSDASIFKSEDARFTITNGEARYVTAARALAEPNLVVGYGLFVPQWRDYLWLHIARVEKGDGDKVKIVYLTTSDTSDNKREGKVSHEITLTKVVEQTITLDPADEFVVTKALRARPKGRRHGKIITWVDEELAD